MKYQNQRTKPIKNFKKINNLKSEIRLCLLIKKESKGPSCNLFQNFQFNHQRELGKRREEEEKKKRSHFPI